MTDEAKTTESRPVEPIKVTVIGTGDASRLETGTKAQTAGAHMPDFVTVVIPPLAAVAVRFMYLFFFTLSGFLTVKVAPSGGNQVLQAIQAVDFYHLVQAGVSVSAAAAGLGLVKDLTTILSGLAARYPLASGNV
ncbi:MAG: hypothetical protein V4597_08515 [Pseudomonadota bacterium]